MPSNDIPRTSDPPEGTWAVGGRHLPPTWIRRTQPRGSVRLFGLKSLGQEKNHLLAFESTMAAFDRGRFKILRKHDKILKREDGIALKYPSNIEARTVARLPRCAHEFSDPGARTQFSRTWALLKPWTPAFDRHAQDSLRDGEGRRNSLLILFGHLKRLSDSSETHRPSKIDLHLQSPGSLPRQGPIRID